MFLVTGTATNLPELVALYKTIGRRTVILYAVMLVAAAMLAGTVVNLWLLPDFVPAFDPLKSLDLLDAGERLQPTVGPLVSLLASMLMVALTLLGIWRRVAAWRRHRSSRSEDCCSG